MKQETPLVQDLIASFEEVDSTKKELKRKISELQDYVDNAAIGLHWVDEKGIIKWANRAELQMLGYSTEEYIGHHISEFHIKQEKISDILQRLSCNETLNQYESELRCKDGSTKTVHITSNVLWEDGKFIHTRCFTVDVTEQKQLFRALQESEARYKGLVNSLPAAIYTCNKEGKITYFNELAVKLWGYKPDTDDALKFCACYKVWMNDGTYVPPDKTPMAITLQTGQAFRNVEALVERPDGSKFYASVNIDPLFDENGQLTGAINIFQDISSLKEAELALKKSEARYRQLIESLRTPLYTTDAKGVITLFNKAAADLWGREPEIGKDIWCGSYKIFNPDGSNLPLEECPMAVCLREQRPVIGEEIIVVRPDGTLRNVAPHPQPIFDESGVMIGAINMLIDITEIKKTEQALRKSEREYKELTESLERKVQEKTQDLLRKNEELKKSEERYHKMVEEVEDYAIILLNKDGIIQNWNKGAEKIKGYREDEIVGKSFEQFYLPEDRNRKLPFQLLEKARKEGKALHEGWRMRKDGSRFWGSIVLTALHDNAETVIGFSKVTRDLTERKLAEEKMAEYTSQLEFQNEQLEQFAYAASHDMKEPLRKIIFYNNHLFEKASSKLAEKEREYLSRSIAAARRMADLIDDLLEYSKASSNTQEFEPVDLNEIIDETILAHRDAVEELKARIHYSNLPVIKGISFQLRQLFDNLISNALKYHHPERTPDISIQSEKIAIADHEGLENKKEYWKITITDNGIGFEEEFSEKIFELFQRLSTTKYSGTGVGLAICKKIIQNHHGIIRASGHPSEGAKFEIFLPV